MSARCPLVLATGFEAFEDHATNPSAGVARGLEQAPPPGVEVASCVLPVSFRRAGAALDEALDGLRAEARVPDLILSFGVHPRPGWRLEARARGWLEGRGRPDNDGVDAAEGNDARARPADAARFCRLDVQQLALALMELSPEPTSLSWDAGGYVCERLYGHALRRADELGAAALFVHVPPAHFTPLAVQVERMRDVLSAALRQTPAIG